ncbi:unnamed protein product, partial [Allacma fusca]
HMSCDLDPEMEQSVPNTFGLVQGIFYPSRPRFLISWPKTWLQVWNYRVPSPHDLAKEWANISVAIEKTCPHSSSTSAIRPKHTPPPINQLYPPPINLIPMSSNHDT